MIEPNMDALNAETESAGAITGEKDSQVESNTPAWPDLDKTEKVLFEGKEVSTKDILERYKKYEETEGRYKSLQSEFTQRNQDRKFYDNLQFDLDKVRGNSALATQFKQIYPEKFHKYLDYLAKTEQGNPAEAQPQARDDSQLMSRLEQIEKAVHEKDISALEAKLEAQDQKFGSKYPMADIEAVYSRAQVMNGQGEKLDEAGWEKLWKADHERHDSRYKAHYKTQVNNQKEANKASKEIPGGGGIPGKAPVRTKLKDVAESIISGMG